ncbi:serine/threonine-protein kinase [Streptomyces sp. N2-109]|uniref:Serine/threonine-protein kinase n=1 Tax=Streptomyces gossypii TaxID=2883101 RepID=A0ABT2K3D8_9ACTN|nr:serine/threonine-protein kinase [Streptomyces gossypii]MCT2594690.1 serine/threonine-protein kinase [Streptomyces gossypii]
MNPLGTGDPLRLGPYRLIGVLGVGGMGKVYLGRDDTGRPAAVKVLRPELAYDGHLVQRFVREAHAAESVRSKGVARVLGAQMEGGRPWIATEFLAGPTLDHAVESYGAFGNAATRALGAVLARTLRDVHAAGLVHRDLKPSNIVLTSGGPRLIDFGIARPEHGLTLTTTGQAPVTPGFGPPEQVVGRRVGPAADIFALGAVLTYAATGERAFSGDHVAAVQYEVVHGEPRLDALPPDLRALVAPCLAKDAAWRPTPDQVIKALAPPRNADSAWTSGALADDIAERERNASRLSALQGDGEPTQGSGLSGITGISRRKLIVGLSTGAVLAAGGGVVWWLSTGDGTGGSAPWEADLLADYEEGTPPPALWGPIRTGAHEASVPLPVRDLVLVTATNGDVRAYDVRDGERRWSADGAEPSAGTAAPAAHSETAFTADASGGLLALKTEDGSRQWTAAADVRTVLAADGGAVYVTTNDNRLRAVSVTSHEPLWTVSPPVRSTAERAVRAVTADGILVVYGSDGKVAGVAAGTGKTVWGPEEQGSGFLTPAVSDDTVYLGGRRLRALALADGKERWARPAAGAGWGSPALAGELLFAGDGAELKACKAVDGGVDWTLTLMNEGRVREAPAPQGNTAWVVLGERGTEGVATVDVRSGKKAWPPLRSGPGRWRSAVAGNRAFLLSGGELTAMPVF